MAQTTSIFFLIFLICSTISKEWYISQLRGDDKNSGTKSHPFLTFQKGYSSINEGDTIFAEIGAYGIQVMKLEKSFKLVGITQAGRLPLFVGTLEFTSKKVSIENLHFESRASFSISSTNADVVSFKKIYFSQSRGMDFI